MFIMYKDVIYIKITQGLGRKWSYIGVNFLFVIHIKLKLIQIRFF